MLYMELDLYLLDRWLTLVPHVNARCMLCSLQSLYYILVPYALLLGEARSWLQLQLQMRMMEMKLCGS